MSIKNKEYTGFDVGPIRPPSEAYSMLLRLSRGCSWNKCKFCSFYRNEPFTIRPVEHIKRDIDQIKAWTERFESGNHRAPLDESDYEAYYVALHWVQGGQKSVFLQDGNSLLVRPDQLVEILEYLNALFPGIERITSYARSDAVARVSEENLRRYAALKFNRIHVGMETGCDELLTLVNKGVTQEIHITAGQKAVRAGMEVNEFYMPGLGGREYAHRSAVDSAYVINQVNPAFARIRSMALAPELDLYEDYQKGIFTRTNDIDNVIEIRTFIEHLDGIQTRVESDHILNILLELRGTLPDDKPNMLELIDKFLLLPKDKQMIFRVGRRLNAMDRLDNLENPAQVKRVADVMESYGIDEGNIDDVCNGLMVRAIPINPAPKE